VNVSGERTFDAPREIVWRVLNTPELMAKTMPGVESFDVQDEQHWTANVKIPLGLGGLRMKINFEKLAERELEHAELAAKGNGVGAIMNMVTAFDLADAGEGRTAMKWSAEVKIAGPGRLDGPARPAADRQPAGRPGPAGARAAGERDRRWRRVGRRAGHPSGLARGVRRGPAGADARHARRALSAVAVPFRVGVMQLTMEPLDEMLESARVMDDAGLDTVWLAEAYPWWRKHGMEARSSTVVSALMAQATKRLTIGWGIISPFTRHPVQVAMDARVVQEAAGPGRFLLGFGTSKIFLNHARLQTKRTLGPMRDAVEIVRGVLGGEAFSYQGETWSADVPALAPEAHSPRDVPPVYVAATAPKMQALAGEIADGCLTPSITTPAFVRYTRENVAADIDIGCTVVASIHETDRERGRDGAREIAGMYLANKVQNIQGAADTLLDLAGLSQDEIRPVAEAMERGGRLAAKAEVTDAILDKCKPIAGTPSDCIAAIEEYRDAGCTHVMLELWGDRRHDQIRLFGEQVLPHFR
jgi:5,10-methylenetetrahydromethanopterin reductase